MKKSSKSVFVLMIAALIVLGAGYMFGGTELIASETDGTTTAVEQQQEAREVIMSIEIPQREEVKEEAVQEETSVDTGAAVEGSEDNGIAAGDTESEAVEEIAAESFAQDQTVESAESAAERPEANIEMVNRGDVYYGDTVKLHASVSGVTGNYRLCWEVNDGAGWKSLNVTGADYSFVINESNRLNDYRVIVEY